MHTLFKQPHYCAFFARVTCVVIFALIFNGCAGPEPKPAASSTTAKATTVAQKKSQPRTTSRTNTTGDKLVSLAQGVLGSPYKYGGSSPNGFDCSGLVYYTHNKLGISVPRTTRSQAQHANILSLRDVEPGDILFFKIYGNRISHVGIYAGNKQFIHAPKSGKFVSYASIDDPFWRQRLVKAGRLH